MASRPIEAAVQRSLKPSCSKSWRQLHLRKAAYDAVSRKRLLEILEGYGVGPKFRRPLMAYWEQQLMVARQAGYFGAAFWAERGVTQGNPLSPTLFNIVVDAIICYWLSIVGDKMTEGIDGVGHSVAERLAAFYADDGLLAARSPEWLQSGFSWLVELFKRVGLMTNSEKTKAMTCYPYSIRGMESAAAYRRQYDSHLPDFKLRKRQRVASSLASHLRMQHSLAPPTDFSSAEAEEHRGDYEVSFPSTTQSVSCPVNSCVGRLKLRNSLGTHFSRRHPHASLRIIEEGPVPLPKCEQCGKHVPWAQLNGSHTLSKACKERARRLRCGSDGQGMAGEASGSRGQRSHILCRRAYA